MVEKMIQTVIFILVFVSLAGIMADTLTDLTANSKDVTNETLGTGPGTYSFDKASLPNAISSLVINNGTNGALTNATHYRLWSENSTVVVNTASGSTGNAILGSYTYIPDQGVNMGTSEKTLIGIIFLVFVTAVVVSLYRDGPF